MNRCPVCRAPISYAGGKVARDADDEPHTCPPPVLGRVLLCACGMIAIDGADGRVSYYDLSPHSCTPPEVLTAEPADPPTPTDADMPAPPARDPRRAPMQPRPRQFTGGVDTSLAD